MNEHDGSETALRVSVSEFQIDPIAWIVILPAALTDFLPHARETGSFFAATPPAFLLDPPEVCSPIPSRNFSGADGTRSSCLLPQYIRSYRAPAMFSSEGAAQRSRNMVGTKRPHDRMHERSKVTL